VALGDDRGAGEKRGRAADLEASSYLQGKLGCFSL